MIEPSTQSGSTTNNFCVATTTTMTTTTMTRATAKKTKTTVTAGAAPATAKKTMTKTAPDTAKKTTTTVTTAAAATAKKTKTTVTTAPATSNKKSTTTVTTAAATAKNTKMTVTTAAKKTMTTTAPATTNKKTKTGHKRKTEDTNGSTKKRSTTTTSSTKNKKKKGPTNKQVVAARNEVVRRLEENLRPKPKKKRATFSEEEDRLLTKAFVNVTLDSKKGKNQKGETFWRKVKDKFDHSADNYWPWKSVKQRYTKVISPACMKFLSFLQKSKAVKQSGWSLEQYIDHANILYIEQHGKSFKYKACMAIIVDLPKFNINPIVVVKTVVEGDGGKEVQPSNPIMAVQGANKKRPMGRKKFKKLNSNSTSTSTLNDTSESNRMIDAMERKTSVFATIHHQRSLQKQASFYLKMGDKEKAQQCMALLEEDQRKCASVPTTVDIRPYADDDTAGSGGGKTNDSRFTSFSKDDDNDDDNNIYDGNNVNEDDNVDVSVSNHDDEVVVLAVVAGVGCGDNDGTTSEKDSDSDSDSDSDNDEDDENDHNQNVSHDTSHKHNDCDIRPPNQLFCPLYILSCRLLEFRHFAFLR